MSVRNERIKLFATYLNTMAAGSFVAGFVAPLISLATVRTSPLFPIATIALIFVALPVALHLAAQVVLGRLKP